MLLKTLQAAVLGGNEDAVLVGLRNFPAHKVVLFATGELMSRGESLAGKLTSTLRLPVEVIRLKDSSISTMIEEVSQIMRKESEDFQDFIINVGSADQHLTCAGVTAAFVHGIRAFDVVGDQPIILPIMNFSYAQMVTEAKMEILRAIEKSGGDVESLEKLSALSNFGKPLLSYHIKGSGEGRGLETLGLVELERGKRGRLRVKVTALGRILLSTGIKESASSPSAGRSSS
jgi:hypothetical protein